MPRHTAERRVSRRYRSLLWQWTRQLWRRPSPVATTDLPDVESGQVSVTRGGHATVLIRYAGLSVLCDPLLSRFCRGVARSEACGLDPEDLDDIDLILISSDEPDHLHRPSLERLSKHATIVLPPGTASNVAGLAFERVLELAPDHGFSLRGVEVTTVSGSPDSLAYVVRGPGPSVFFCGASGYTTRFRAVGEALRPDLALLPIGGYRPDSFRRRHLSPVDALMVFEDLRARVMVPHRYGAFALSYETLDDPERWLSALVAERDLDRYVQPIEVGATQIFVPPRGRAQTQIGEPRRPLETASPASGETGKRRGRKRRRSSGEDADWEPVDIDAPADVADPPDDGDPEAKP